MKLFTKLLLSSIVSTSLIFSGLFGSPVASADNNNYDLQIDAKHQDLDYKNNTLYFYGGVTVQVGDMSIVAQELFVNTKDGVGQKLIAKGTPAVFSRKENPETGSDGVDASANEIVFVFDEEILRLIGDAKFRQGNTDVAGGLIEFDLVKERVQADGGSEEGSRVTTTIKTAKKKQNKQQDNE